MKIYVGHSSSFDYRTELYQPLQELDLVGCEFVFPHVDSEAPTNSKEQMKSIDLMIAEVSYPSTGLGIEIGWADSLNKPIVCIHKAGTVPSTAISGVCREITEYDSLESLKEAMKKVVKQFS